MVSRALNRMQVRGVPHPERQCDDQTPSAYEAVGWRLVCSRAATAYVSPLYTCRIQELLSASISFCADSQKFVSFLALRETGVQGNVDSSWIWPWRARERGFTRRSEHPV